MKRYIRNLIGFIILFLISFTGEAKASEPEFFATKEAAAAYVREQMVLREEIISFSMEISYNEQIFKEILLLAVDHETAEEAEQGDYLRCHSGGFYGVAAKQEDTGRYLLTYTIIYYTTYEQESQVTQQVVQILNGLGLGGQSAYE